MPNESVNHRKQALTVDTVIMLELSVVAWKWAVRFQVSLNLLRSAVAIFAWGGIRRWVIGAGACAGGASEASAEAALKFLP